MILATVRMTLPPQRLGQISKTLKSMATETGIQLGCCSSRLYHDENEEGVFMFEQIWRNQEELDLYLRTEHYRRMLLLMDMAGEPPEIKFYTISDPAGIEVIEKARGCRRNDDV